MQDGSEGWRVAREGEVDERMGAGREEAVIRQRGLPGEYVLFVWEEGREI